MADPAGDLPPSGGDSYSPTISTRREGRLLTVTVMWDRPITARAAGAYLLLLASAIEAASEGRDWALVAEPSTAFINGGALRWGSVALALSHADDGEFAAAEATIGVALRSLASRCHHG